MKLRVKGNSLRFRLSKSDVAGFAQSGEITETVYFGPAPDAKLSYALKISQSGHPLSVEYMEQQVTVLVDNASVSHWATKETEVGIYGSVDIGRGALELLIEKDFACLDASDEENQDTFPNPIACQPASK